MKFELKILNRKITFDALKPKTPGNADIDLLAMGVVSVIAGLTDSSYHGDIKNIRMEHIR